MMMLKNMIIWFILIAVLVAIIFISIRLYKKSLKDNTPKKKMFFAARWVSQRASKKTGIEIEFTGSKF